MNCLTGGGLTPPSRGTRGSGSTRECSTDGIHAIDHVALDPAPGIHPIDRSVPDDAPGSHAILPVALGPGTPQSCTTVAMAGIAGQTKAMENWSGGGSQIRIRAQGTAGVRVRFRVRIRARVRIEARVRSEAKVRVRARVKVGRFGHEVLRSGSSNFCSS